MGGTTIGTLEELKAKGCLTGKVGALPVCVFWADERAYALEDRCPHMGFPLHRGSVEDGLVTCHWHHARFDLASGGTLDPFADDVAAHEVELRDGEVVVTLVVRSDQLAHLLARLEEGLEQGLSLVIAKAVLGLFDLLGPDAGATAAIEAGVAFGVANRDRGWGAGLTVLSVMANVLRALDERDRALALVHGLAFVSRDTRGHPPRFALAPLSGELPAERIASWYRRFVDTRNGDAAERVLASGAGCLSLEQLASVMGAAATDHVVLDGGHTIDFTNKAFELLDLIGEDRAVVVLATLAHETASASRSEETGTWRHPEDLVGLLAQSRVLARALPERAPRTFCGDEAVDALAWLVLGEDPAAIVEGLDVALEQGATPAELARAVAYAAALRLVRFHTQNDHGDWDEVHHGFTTANAVHQLVERAPTLELLRGVYQGALKVYLDRFLNVPAARLPGAWRLEGDASLEALATCFERQDMVDEAGAIVYRCLRGGLATSAVVAALGRALLGEDAGFHWYQTYEAALRQASAWPAGSEQAALILAGTARFLAAHTPTRRELPQVVRIATRLRRGEPLYDKE